MSLSGGAGSCLNNHTAAGIAIDPINLETIPLNKIIRVPVSWEVDDFLRQVPTAATDYYCFNQTTLLEWLKTRETNPLTGAVFTPSQGLNIVDQIKGPRYTWFNGYISPFSHPLNDAAAGPNPWPPGLIRVISPGFL